MFVDPDVLVEPLTQDLIAALDQVRPGRHRIERVATRVISPQQVASALAPPAATAVMPAPPVDPWQQPTRTTQRWASFERLRRNVGRFFR